MAINYEPIFTGTPDNQWTATITAVNAAMDGTGTVNLLHATGADGGFVGVILGKAKGTNVPSVARIFLNNGSDPTVAANNSLVGEITLPATTAAAAGALTEVGYFYNKTLKANHRLYITLGTAVAAGWQFSSEGGSYTKT